MGAPRLHDEFGLEGATILDRYVIEAAVAAGGFGVVYRSRHTLLQRDVAIKVLKVPGQFSDDARAEFIRMFLQEAQIIASLRHPAVVRVLDFGAVRCGSGDEVPWMALDWVDGVPLSVDLAWRRGAGGRTPREALALLGPIAEALAEAHARGIVHRDVKPANMMIPSAETAPRNARGAPLITRLLDFGIAKVMEEGEATTSGNTQTQSAMTAFSARYASPEQVSGMRTGPWTDVHALGLIFTEVLTDQAPYGDADKLALTMQVMSPTRPTPARFGVDVGAWELVLAKALAVHPSERFTSAGEFLSALESSLPAASDASLPTVEASAPTPVPAPPMPAVSVVPPVVHRARGRTIAFAFAALALAALTAVATHHVGSVRPPVRTPVDVGSTSSPPRAPPTTPTSPPPTPTAPTPASAAVPVTQTLANLPATAEPTTPTGRRTTSARGNARPVTATNEAPLPRQRPVAPVAPRGASLHDRPNLE